MGCQAMLQYSHLQARPSHTDQPAAGNDLASARSEAAQLRTEKKMMEMRAQEMAAELLQRNMEMDDLERLFSEGMAPAAQEARETGDAVLLSQGMGLAGLSASRGQQYPDSMPGKEI